VDSLSWAASTPEGARLGELASQTVRITREADPLWLAPVEPLRWTIGIGSVAPHALYGFAAYACLALTIAAVVAARHWRDRGAPRQALAVFGALFTAFFVTFLGLHLGLQWIDTRFSRGDRWIVPPDAPYVLADLHAHSEVSGGMLTPEGVVRWHAERGYGALALTDTNTTAGVARAMAYARQYYPEMVVVSGEEYCGSTHILMLGISRDVSSIDTPLEAAIQEARGQGAVVIAAHAWTGENSYPDLVAMGVQGFEYTNGDRFGGGGMRNLCETRHLPELGNLDFRAGRFPRTATVLPRTVGDQAGLLAALRRAECAALYFPHRVKSSDFPFKKSLTHWWNDCASTAGLPLILGGLFWAGLALLFRRLWHAAPPTRGQPLVRVLTLGTALVALAAACLWWRLKLGFAPRIEWFLACWLMGCPAIWLACRDVLAKNQTA